VPKKPIKPFAIPVVDLPQGTVEVIDYNNYDDDYFFSTFEPVYRIQAEHRGEQWVVFDYACQNVVAEGFKTREQADEWIEDNFHWPFAMNWEQLGILCPAPKPRVPV